MMMNKTLAPPSPPVQEAPPGPPVQGGSSTRGKDVGRFFRNEAPPGPPVEEAPPGPPV